MSTPSTFARVPVEPEEVQEPLAHRLVNTDVRPQNTVYVLNRTARSMTTSKNRNHHFQRSTKTGGAPAHLHQLTHRRFELFLSNSSLPSRSSVSKQVRLVRTNHRFHQLLIAKNLNAAPKLGGQLRQVAAQTSCSALQVPPGFSRPLPAQSRDLLGELRKTLTNLLRAPQLTAAGIA